MERGKLVLFFLAFLSVESQPFLPFLLLEAPREVKMGALIFKGIEISFKAPIFTTTVESVHKSRKKDFKAAPNDFDT